jgi:hypothetical protein
LPVFKKKKNLGSPAKFCVLELKNITFVFKNRATASKV